MFVLVNAGFLVRGGRASHCHGTATENRRETSHESVRENRRETTLRRDTAGTANPEFGRNRNRDDSDGR
jgi:hypothetical protein